MMPSIGCDHAPKHIKHDVQPSGLTVRIDPKKRIHGKKDEKRHIF